jgi:hypothetical protein
MLVPTVSKKELDFPEWYYLNWSLIKKIPVKRAVGTIKLCKTAFLSIVKLSILPIHL